jgi:hypothetical protein
MSKKIKNQVVRRLALGVLVVISLVIASPAALSAPTLGTTAVGIWHP